MDQCNGDMIMMHIQRYGNVTYVQRVKLWDLVQCTVQSTKSYGDTMHVRICAIKLQRINSMGT